MADRVRAAMEKMVPELEDLQNRELCTLREVKLLAKRREHHEYLIAGRAPSKEDFLRYLQLEMNLEALLKLRSKTEKKAKVNAAVVAVRRRVHYFVCCVRSRTRKPSSASAVAPRRHCARVSCWRICSPTSRV